MGIGIQNKQERNNFDEFMERFKEEREVIQEPTIPEPEPVEPSDTLPEIDNVPDPAVERQKLDVAMIPAETIVDVIDTTAVSLNSYIAHEPQEGATESEKKSLQNAVANYLKDTDIDISPGKLCLVLILMIYGPKTMQAFQTRKHNQENAALREHIAELEDQIAQREMIAQRKRQGKEDNDGTVPSV